MRGILILTWWWICTCFGQAQTPIAPEELTIEDGLSQGFISSIIQDREGFLWFGTKNGLNRYDGRQFEVFTYNPEDPYSISNDWVQSITEEGDILLLGTQSTALNLFHKKTKRFYQIPLEVNGIKAFAEIKNIKKDKAGQYWISTLNVDQLLRVVFPKDFWGNFPADTSLLQQVQIDLALENYSYFIPSDAADIIRINGYAIPNLRLNIHTLDTLAAEYPHNQFPSFFSLTSKLGLSKEANPATVNPLQLSRLQENGLWEKIPSNLLFKNDWYYDEQLDWLWVQHYENNILYAFDEQTLLEKEQLSEKDAIYSVPNLNIQNISYCKDRSGILWMGTAGLGVRKISPRKLAIKTYMQNHSVVNNLFSSEAEEMYYYQPGEPRFYKAGQSKTLQPIDALVQKMRIAEAYWLTTGVEKGWLVLARNFLGYYDAQLLLYYFENGTINELTRVQLHYMLHDSELSMVMGNDQKIYIAFSNDFVRYDPSTNTHEVFRIDLFSINSPTVFYLTQTSNGDFWLGTSQGLIRAKAKSNGFEFEWLKGLRNDICASLLTDPTDANILWIGTKGGGLHRLDTKTMTLEYLNTENGLPNDVIYAVLNDENGNLWMSSNKGIISYNPKTGDIRNFTSKDGMQSDEFNTYAFGKSPDGTLLFGGIKGLNVFHPDDLQDSPHLPEVRITGLEINNQAVSTLDSASLLNQAIEYTDQIKLSHQQNNLTLFFAALEYAAPSKNQFNYYLEGAEPKWIHTSTENRAAYLNLDPGKYTFHIKAANGDGVWNETVRQLDITILPPWYRTTLAYFLYVVLLALGAWSFSRFQRNRVKLKHDLELEQKEAERLKELDAFRSKLYTNITHEFRTPLTVMLGTSQQLSAQRHADHPEQKQLALIQRSGRNLLNLVNQMLDLSKIEHNGLTTVYKQGNILDYLRYIIESFFSLANSNNVSLKLQCRQHEIWMDYDAEKFRQIISNLLSNAIKHTPSGGKIIIWAAQQDDQFLLKVEDTGKGIPETDLPYIFNRFYQVEQDVDRSGSSGIGLALTQELVYLLDGNISVKSTLGKGTTFEIQLPIRQEAPLQETLPPVEQADISIPTAPTPSSFSAADALQLLIVEDNLDVVEYLSSCLRPHYQLDFAYNGQAGIEKAMENVPDIVISDVMMPEKTGLELTEALKKEEYTSHIPIVLLTAKADMESRIKGIKQGADAYLVKPFYEQELLAVIENLIENRRKIQQKYSKLTTEQVPVISPSPEELFLQKVRSIVEEKIDDPTLNIAQLCQKLGKSRSQVYKKIKALTGKSPSQFIRLIRLNHAQQLLQTTSMTISEVAYAAGFSSLSYFSNLYLEEFGIRPNETRK